MTGATERAPEDEAASHGFASKADLKDGLKELKADIKELKADLKDGLKELKADLFKVAGLFLAAGGLAAGLTQAFG